MTDWDESEHPRDRRGRFTDAASGGWAAQTVGRMGLRDPEFEAAMQRQQQWVVDTFDTVTALLGEPGQNPYWVGDHYEHLQNMLRNTPSGFERDPGLYRARLELHKYNPYGEDTPLIPWARGIGATTDEQKMAAYPYWRSEVARLLDRQGYNLDMVEQYMRETGKTHLVTDEEGYLSHHSVDPPRITVKFLVRELEDIPPDQDRGWLRTATADFDNRMEGDHGGKQLKAQQLDEHPDFATSGEFEIWLDGGWHLLEEVYHDDPNEEEIEVIAGDQHLMIDTSDDIELRRIPIEQRPRRRWWE